jgi:hypothetical protein
MKKVLQGILFSLCFLAVNAPAQTIGTPGPSTGPIGWGMNNLFYSNRVFQGMVANSMVRKGAKNNPRRTPPKTEQTKSATDYTVFRQAPGSLLVKSIAGKTNGQNQREIEQIFGSFINLYKQTAQKDGFPANDLAYAFEYFVVNNYQLYHDLISLDPDKDPRAKRAKDGFERITILNEKKLLQVSMNQERTVYNQFKDVLAGNPEIQKMTDAQKQEAAELLAVMFGVNFAGYMKGINDDDERLAEQARQLAREGLEKLLGVPVGQIKITNNGLEL